jgi:DUF1680 family protein
MVRTISLFLCLISVCLAAEWRDQAILHLSASPHAKLHPVPVRAVKFHEGFWKKRQTAAIERSIPTLLELLEQNGVVDNFRRLTGAKNVPRRGPLYTDSDLYKWMEAAAWSLHVKDDPQLRATIERLTGEILAAQEPSGYLNTYFVEERVKDRFQRMQSGHELYCLGHLLQAGIAYYRATGNRKLLEGGMRFVDYLIRDFGPAPKKPLLTGHPELELALAELYRTTGQRKYLDLAGYLLSGVERERLNLRDSEVRYMFSGIPFVSRIKFEGHAVRAMYAATGAADYYIETGDAAYRRTLDLLWQDYVSSKMYVTGGVGSRSQGESFGEPYELPNLTAYAESCAAIGSLIFNQRLLAMTGDAKYADVMERALYNAINSGMSLDGTLYCYRNPLASAGEKIRNPWYSTTCCPPNLQRTFAALGGYFYSTSREGVYVHFYDNSEVAWKLESGTAFRLTQTTGMPWRGTVSLKVEPAAAEEFTLFLRIPAWSKTATVTVNGARVSDPARPGHYFPIRRTWKAGDRVELALAVAPSLVTSNPRVENNWGKAAVQAGPLIYCIEQPDHPGVSVFDVALSRSGAWDVRWEADLLGGVQVLRRQGWTWKQPLSGQPLYSPMADAAAPTEQLQLTFIPYYAWANRGPNAMQVWLPVR